MHLISLPPNVLIDKNLKNHFRNQVLMLAEKLKAMGLTKENQWSDLAHPLLFYGNSSKMLKIIKKIVDSENHKKIWLITKLLNFIDLRTQEEKLCTQRRKLSVQSKDNKIVTKMRFRCAIHP